VPSRDQSYGKLAKLSPVAATAAPKWRQSSVVGIRDCVEQPVVDEPARLDQTVLSAPFEPFARVAAGMMRDLPLALYDPARVECILTDQQNIKDMAVLLARAYLVAAVAGMRYWQRVAQTYGMHQPGILRSLLTTAAGPGLSGGERRVQADEVCAYFREIGEISVQEARAFQAELESLAEGVARMARGSQQPTANRRRWRAKP
jgi:hypothetical protein